MEKDWRNVFQKELCEHGIELDLNGRKFKGLITALKQSKCPEAEIKFEHADLIAYIDADTEAPPIGSTMTSSNGEKLTVASLKFESRIGTPSIAKILFLKHS